jgi:processive 1,2-diacylglycerol beta-glucosyltransferase
MPKVKKLLILSCSTGMGHWRAGEALRLSCQKLYPTTEVVHIDIAKYLNILAYLYIIFGYDLFSKTFPSLYKILYYQTDNLFTQRFFKIFGPLLALGAQRLFTYIDTLKPDAIICTHFIPTLILPKKISVPIDTVITDYHAHTIWLAPRTDKFFVATDVVKQSLEKINIKSTVSGIPIYPEFLKEKNVQDLKIKLGIGNNWPTILVMPIFADYKQVQQITQAIASYKQEINVVVIAGKNEKLFKKLSEHTETNITIIKKSECIDEWMRIADIIISKAGGLTISEAMFLQKPIIIMNPIPGQEDYNTIYLEEHKFGLHARSTTELIKKIEQIFTDPTIIHKKSYPDPSKIILDTVLQTE